METLNIISTSTDCLDFCCAFFADNYTIKISFRRNSKFTGVGYLYLVFKTNDGRSKGRAGFTLKDSDLYKFKVPQLYNLKGNGFYFHGASKHTLREVVEYFNLAVPENADVAASRIDGRFRPLNLTSTEVDDLTDFLENALYDANLLRYKPSSVLSGNCFPNNDEQSKIDMGCK